MTLSPPRNISCALKLFLIFLSVFLHSSHPHIPPRLPLSLFSRYLPPTSPSCSVSFSIPSPPFFFTCLIRSLLPSSGYVSSSHFLPRLSCFSSVSFHVLFTPVLLAMSLSPPHFSFTFLHFLYLYFLSCLTQPLSLLPFHFIFFAVSLPAFLSIFPPFKSLLPHTVMSSSFISFPF